MLKIAICDDDINIIKYINNGVSEFLNTKNIDFTIKTYSLSKDLLGEYYNDNFDVVFLDIEMPEITGDMIAETIRKLNDNSLIIFVTSHDEMVFSMLKYTPFRFIRKSEIKAELPEALEGAIKELSKINAKQIIKTSDGDILFDLKDIVYFESILHDLICHTKDSTYVVKDTLKNTEINLSSKGFIKTHKSYLVNYRFIFSINRCDIELTYNNIKIPLSKYKTEEVKNKLILFSRKNMRGN